MKRKYQVFISSTYIDLVEERAAVTQCLLENDCIPVGMEQFPASGMSQMEYIKMMLQDCDYYLLILAGRYGSLDTDGIGFTEKEYDYAMQLGLPIMSFLVRDIGNVPSSKCEKNDEGKALLERFRNKASCGKLVKYYDNIWDLKGNVATSINRCIKDFPARGWIRLDDSEIAEHVDVSRFVEATIASKRAYDNPEMRDTFTFDYSNNNGEFTIGKQEFSFTTKWSKASDKSIHAYKDPANIKGIARLRGPVEWDDILSGKLESLPSGELDFSSRSRTAQIGDIIIWRNNHDKYAATKVIGIMDDSRESEHDELTCEYVIYQ